MSESCEPLVSVVIPTYNAESFIVETIESVLSQDWESWEVLVVDDRSTDKTVELVEEIAKSDTRVKCMVLDENSGGPAGPRNVGVSNSRGEFVAFLDADDIWHPRKLSIQLKALNDSEKRFCSSSMEDFYDSSKLTPGDCRESFVEVSYQALCWRNAIPNSTVLAERDLLVSFPLNEDSALKAVEDYDCWLRVHEEIGVSVKCEDILMFYRKQPDQISGSKLQMLRKVFLVHLKERKVPLVIAIGRSFTHALGGVYYRLLRKRM